MAKSILKTVHETAKGLHKAGTMDAMTMREFDALCLPPVKIYTPTQIKRLRTRYKASQAVFAAYLNTSPSTVQKWEQGQKKPNGPSLKLLNLVDMHGAGSTRLKGGPEEILSGSVCYFRVNRHSMLTRPVPLEGASLYVSDDDINFSLGGVQDEVV